MAGLYEDYSDGNDQPVLISPLAADDRLFQLAGRIFIFTPAISSINWIRPAADKFPCGSRPR